MIQIRKFCQNQTKSCNKYRVLKCGKIFNFLFQYVLLQILKILWRLQKTNILLHIDMNNITFYDTIVYCVLIKCRRTLSERKSHIYIFTFLTYIFILDKFNLFLKDYSIISNNNSSNIKVD